MFVLERRFTVCCVIPWVRLLREHRDIRREKFKTVINRSKFIIAF